MSSLFAAKPEKQIFKLTEQQDLAGLKKLLVRAPRAATALDPDTGGTALHAASYCGWEAGVIALLGAGADPNATDLGYGATPLHLAVTKNHLQVSELLVQGGSNLGARHKNGHTPIMVSLERHHLEILALLLTKDGNPKEGADQLPLLSWACMRWFQLEQGFDHDLATQAIRMLAAAGFEVDPATHFGVQSPLYLSVRCASESMVKTLIELGADPRRSPPGNDFTVIKLAKFHSTEDAARQRIFDLLSRA